MVTVVVACLVFAALFGCESKASSDRRARWEYQRALIDELCGAGTFYSECVWPYADICHDQMSSHVDTCMRMEIGHKQQRPGETLREAMLDCIFGVQSMFLGNVIPLVEKDECVDAAHWQHVPSSRDESLALIKKRRSEKKSIHLAPATTDTAPGPRIEPAPETTSDAAPAD